MPRKKAAPKDKGGRPPKCTDKFLAEFEALLRDGAHPKAAALSLGISSDSWTRWQDWGAADGKGNYPNTPYGKFCGILSRVSAIARVNVDKGMYKAAAAGDVGAAKVFYQRVRAENFEPQNLAAITLPGTDDDDAILGALAARLSGLSDARAAAKVPRES